MQTPANAGNCCDCIADQVTILGVGSPGDPFRTAAGPDVDVFVPGAGAGSAIQNNGSGNAATGTNSIAMGTGTAATGPGAHSEGGNSNAGGAQAHAEGNSTIASGDQSHVEGLLSQSQGVASHGAGIRSMAIRQGQFSQSSGQAGTGVAPVAGAAQTSFVTMTGHTAGGGANEATELVLGEVSAPFTLEDGKAYNVKATVIAGGVQAGPVRKCQGFTARWAIRRDAGVSVIAGSGATDKYGDAAAADWTFVATIGVAPDRVVFTFTTGAIASTCRVEAKIEFEEVTY